jgi:DNA-binding Xre family transcriptional regulator
MNSNAALNTVAKAIKISPSRLSKIEQGLCPHCRFGTLVMLCKYYKIKLTDVATKGKFRIRNGIAITKKKT